MSLSPEMRELLARIRQEMENATWPPSLLLDRAKNELVETLANAVFHQKLTESVAKAIAYHFSHAVILALTQDFRRIVADEIGLAVRGLRSEMAQIRAWIQRDIDGEDWWKHGPADADEQGGDETPPTR
jgi:hypothetical protein